MRELRNVLDRALALTPGARRFADLIVRVEPAAGGAADAVVRTDLPFAEAKQLVLHDFERRYLADVLARADGNVTAAARLADVDRKHLRTLARRHGLLDAGDDGDDE